MAEATTRTKIKTALRISHSALDADIDDMIDACRADLVLAGIRAVDESDPLILAAIKLYVRAGYTDVADDADRYRAAYDRMKGSLQIATGYGKAADE